MVLLLGILSLVSSARDVLVQDGAFVSSATGQEVLLVGANVVMKGPPWIPSVSGHGACETSNSSGSNSSCQTFNDHDALHLRSQNYNFVRLGVPWAGGQPDNGDVLDPVFVSRLHAFLDLAHNHSIAVVLDVHQDAVGSAVCGEGVPMWFSKLATPHHIGKPLWPLTEKQKDGSCGLNDTKTWAQFAGDADYNIKVFYCVKSNHVP